MQGVKEISFEDNLKGLKAVIDFASRIGGQRCPLVYGCRALSRMTSEPPRERVISMGGSINPPLVFKDMKSYKSLMLGLCCNGARHYELCEIYLKNAKDGKIVVADLEELKKQDIQAQHDQLLQAFNGKGWDLYIQKIREGGVDCGLLRKMGSATEIEFKKVYVPWPKNHPFGDFEALGEGLARGTEFFRLSVGCPESKPGEVRFRTVAHQTSYSEVLEQGQTIDFNNFRVYLNGNVKLSYRGETHMHIDSFLIALETLEDISLFTKQAPKATSKSKEADNLGDSETEVETSAQIARKLAALEPV